MKAFGTLRPGPADALTITNALLGAAALVVAVAAPGDATAVGAQATMRTVSLLVLAGVVLDVCDGAVARALGATPLGHHLDSLADVVTFGLAAAVPVGALTIRRASPAEAAALGVAMLAYVAATVVRLADFDARRKDDRLYTGMPSPLAAITALSIGLLALEPWLTAAGIAATAWLMVSGVRYPRSRGAGLVAEAVGLAVAVVGIVGLIDVRIPATLALLGCVVVAPATLALSRRRARDDADPVTAESAAP